LFPLFWNEDFDLHVLFESGTSDSKILGEKSHFGLNFSLEPILPLESWFSALDSKILAGRSLFEQTHRERNELIASILKSKQHDQSPVIVLPSASAQEGDANYDFVTAEIKFIICNTSWIHGMKFRFYLVSNEEDRPGLFSWHGRTVFEDEIPPLQHVTVTAHAIFPYRGIYNVNKWTMDAQLSVSADILEFYTGKQGERKGKEFKVHPNSAHEIVID
jgi:hypothetical protein